MSDRVSVRVRVRVKSVVVSGPHRHGSSSDTWGFFPQPWLLLRSILPRLSLDPFLEA